MIKAINHTGISTGDLDRLVRFYRDLLGFEVEMEFGWPAGSDALDRITGLHASAARAAMLRSGHSRIEIFEYASPMPRRAEPRRPVCDHGITHLCFEVSDV